MPEPSTGEKIAAWFNSLAAAFVEEFQALLRRVWPGAMASITDEDRQKIIDTNIRRNERLAALPYMPDPLLGEIREAGEGDSLLSQLKAILLDVAEASAVLRFGMAPAGIKMNYEAERILQTARFDAASATAMLHRNLIGFDTYEEGMSDLGWSPAQQQAWVDLIRDRPGVGDYVQWSYRIQQNPEGARDELTRRGMTPDDIAVVFELSRLIPGPGDLVRFALREVWKPEMRAEQLSPDAPEEYYTWMQKLGYGREHAESFWAAHWVLPSVGHGYEMYHRLDDFTEADLRALMTRLDILPKYHDGLIRIAHPPISRVDIRRIYRDLPAGSVDVYRRHLDLGYSPSDAELMTAWVEKEYIADVTEPLKSDILGAYGDDLIDSDAALQMLLDIGVDPWAAEIALDRKDIAKAKTLQGERIRQVKTLYVNEDYDRSEVHAVLGVLNLPAIRIDRLLEEWNITKVGKVARPSVAKLETYFYKDIITREEFTDHLSRHKYAAPYLNWAVEDVLLRKADAAEKEAERVKKEQERIAASEIKTAEDELLAKLNVEIAIYRVAIADLQLALLSPPDDVAEFEWEQAILVYKAEIARLNQRKAEIRLAYIKKREEG